MILKYPLILNFYTGLDKRLDLIWMIASKTVYFILLLLFNVDRKSSFLFFGDIKAYYREYLGPLLNDGHGLANMNFSAVF